MLAPGARRVHESVGDPMVERLQRESTAFEGLKFTGVSKQQ